ncbi:hypothetical protein GALMADRAFT_95057 [Galerina marginata CBS 339.88]|uniref:RING-type domain-containing protein n=1 Tax=Galerina marginata (strain CBS 339.88) TaxID=685588 RepID=A0A067THB7_GALM3|nr:hypothetical protein GALMADRAFT_95057 [Galerina marginata CBS 339.88]
MAPAYDLLIVTDATASMGTYLQSLRKSIPEILAVSTLSGAFERLGVISYKDYCDEPDIVAWSGWNSPDLVDFVEKLQASGGGDYPEAAKSALIRALQEVKRGGSKNTLVLWYADAPPHHPSIRSHVNDTKEIKAFPEGSTDWVKLSFLAHKLNFTVFSFVPTSMDNAYSAFYVLLSQLTGGLCVASEISSSGDISRLTLEIVLQWMGQGADVDARLTAAGVTFSRFDTSPQDVQSRPTNENDGSLGFLPPSLTAKAGTPLRAVTRSPLRAADIPIGPLASEQLNLSQRFKDPSQTAFREQVYTSLHKVIDLNVHALTYNAVFGQLWRAVCSQPPSEEQSALLNAFSSKVGSVNDATQKKGLQDWLEESYDATGQIEDIIARAPPGSPEVYLDLDTDVELTRVELLEVSRSCYSALLKKLATIFTHLKIVEPGLKLAPGQRTLPLSLFPVNFFRVLPHLVVPGTLYPARAASLTAVLSLITSVPFLKEPAIELLTPLKGTWINLEVPENLSFDCAKFLLSAPDGVVLTKKEKKIYAAMRRYKMIELNLESTLHLQVPWTPEKTREVGDQKIECQQCHIRRSITLMSGTRKNICGLCIDEGTPALFPDQGDMYSSWVECAMKNCRAQYVVEDVKGLRVRPKCYYCRNKKPCPWLECTRCANRIIVPEPYRTKGKYLCPACDNPNTKIATVVNCETTPSSLNTENGLSWLGLTENKDILQGKSAFKLITAHGTAIFDFAVPQKGTQLTVNSKKAHNPEEALAQVMRWVGSGEVELGTCALCFDETTKNKLLPACGRKGCAQKADTNCLREWYSKSEPGKLLNVMQLACPFCRRRPDHRTLSRYNPQAMALGGLKEALEDRQYYYAWCIECGFAKQAYERVCCNEGRLPPLRGFRCQECIQLSEARIVEIQNAEEAEAQALGQQYVFRKELRKVKPIRITKCPSCNTPVEKIDGCNHITCTCGQHFCHVCGAGERWWSPDDCYGHMSKAHGGIYEHEMTEEDDEDE